MASMNRVLLLGNVGRDPEVRYTQGGTAVANLSLATTERYTKDGEKKEKTEWHRVTAWAKTAEIIGEYVKKGAQLLVEGRLQTREWQDKDGNKRYTTEIVADRVQFVGGKRDGEPVGATATQGGASASTAEDDDIPF
jgi:single-strand DNA-binding protein